MHTHSSEDERRQGYYFSIGAYLFWGLAPIYFKAIAHVPAAEILAHRIAWSVPVCVLLLFLLGKPQTWLKLLRQPTLLARLTLSASFVSFNWFIFVWAIANDRILDTSLGYFINPLLTIALGVVVLNEKLSRLKVIALGFAALGVVWQVVVIGGVPWVSLGLALSFAIYGLMRKQIVVSALDGLAIETLVFTPLAIGYIVFLWAHGAATFLQFNTLTDSLLALAGFITVIPLALFAAGARRLPLNTLGFLQYLSPSCTFLLAIFLYHEPFTAVRMASFGCIWAGLLLLAIDAMRAQTGAD